LARYKEKLKKTYFLTNKVNFIISIWIN